MSDVILPDGTTIAQQVCPSSEQERNGVIPSVAVKTIGDLLAILKQQPPPSFGVLRTTCGHLSAYLNQPTNEISFETIEATRGGFRQFLASRGYAENSIRVYVDQIRVLLKTARGFGWIADDATSDEWKALLVLAAEAEALEIARYFSRITKTPADVTIEEVDQWEQSKIRDGVFFSSVRRARNRFVRLLQRSGWTTLDPAGLRKQANYGIPLDQLPSTLCRDIQALLKWKQVDFAPNRPKRGKIRAVSANKLRGTLCQLAGYVINVCGIQVESARDLLQQKFVEGFVEWMINERGVKGRSFRPSLGMLAAVVKYHPAYASSDFSWFKPLLDSIPIEDESDRKQRKTQKYVEYEVLEAIPGKIRAERRAYERKRKKSITNVARLAMEEFIMLWLTILPWRQRNVRECRIAGPTPNLFKGKIPPFSQLDKPAWVIEEEARNPNAEFWQIRFSPKETKTGIAIHVLLPRQLIAPLEQYLSEYRPLLLPGRDIETLFINRNGKPLNSKLMGRIVGHWTLRYGSLRTTPHLFRDAVAFKWLKEHPKDYLTLSKMLWHKNIETTLEIYDSRFNESSGVCAMEAWLDQREANAA